MCFNKKIHLRLHKTQNKVVEILKSAGIKKLNELTKAILQIWQSEEILDDWKVACYIPYTKKEIEPI